MTAGRPPVPFRLKVLRGNPGQRRLRPEPEPPISPECPGPPSYIVGHAADEWRRLAPELHRLGLLTLADVTVFEGYCIAYARWREAEERLVGAELIIPGARKGTQFANPLIAAAAQARRDVLRFGAEFGITPASRARVSAAKVPLPGKFGDLIS
jgi:P27 family predicted phage terminase small subunit